jgi:regulator of sigma E protease
VWQRLATIFAGPATNYLFASFMLLFMFLAWGVPGLGKAPMVDSVLEGTPAATSGFQPEDEIVAVNGTKVKEYQQVRPLVNTSQGNEITVDIVRFGKPMSIKVKPEKDGSEYRIGVQLTGARVWEQVPTGERVRQALLYPFSYSVYALRSLGTEGLSGIIKHGSGPVGIVKEMRKRIALGAKDALWIVAIISIYLGLFNLLPVPGLDGGRLVFLGWEAISRRPVNQRIEQTIHMVGVLMLLTLIVVVTVKNDSGIISWLKKH